MDVRLPSGRCVVALYFISVRDNPALPVFQDQAFKLFLSHSHSLSIQSLTKSVICKYLLDLFLHPVHTTANPSPALDCLHLSYCNNFLVVSPQGHPLCHCHCTVNLLCTTIPLLNGLPSHQIKLRLLSLEFTAPAEVISPSFCILPPSSPLALLYLCPPR